MKTFLEIGTASFDTLIPLAEKGGWKGVCVEPLPLHIVKLKNMCRGLPVSLVEAAITSFNGEITMAVGYPKSGKEEDKWCVGAAHVLHDNHHGDKMLLREINKDKYLGETTVKAMTLDTLIHQEGLEEIDYCKIDVEGHEQTILESYSWRVKPKFMKVEHFHSDRDLLKRLLESQGYTVLTERWDYYAFLA